MATLCLRFDVDSHRCLREGVPALLGLLGEHAVPATFFVNMGRLTSRPRMVRHRLAGGRDSSPKATLPLSTKLGRRGIAEVVALNPRVGAASPGLVARIAAEGHEVGLHGGRSHRRWQDDAPAWDVSRVESEVRWGLARLARSGVAEVRGFSSPGWGTSTTVAGVVQQLGFTYLADDHAHGVAEVDRTPQGLVRVPTNLVGEPGGVGYLEWHRAQGHDDERIEADFTRRLDASGGLAVLYDHPFHAGIGDLAMLDRLVGVAAARGWELTTMGAVADAA